MKSRFAGAPSRRSAVANRSGAGLSGGLLFGAAALLGWKVVNRLRAADLTDKVVLITGGSRGLGLLLAQKFGAAGARVVICARDEDELDRARTDLRARGIQVVARRCDVADRDAVERLVAETVQTFGRIDIAVNNAGIVQVGPFETMTTADFARAMAVNFWGPLNVVMAVTPAMRRRKSGQIINVTSIGGKVPVPHLLPYSCAKAAFVSLSEGLYAELAKDGIAVTTVIPGLMRTGSPVNAFFKGEAEREMEWFTVSDSLRISSMSADRASSQIVTAARQRSIEVVLGWQAKVARFVHGAFPALALQVEAGINRLLPAATPGSRREAVRGRALQSSLVPSRWTENSAVAADRLNQNGQPEPSPTDGRFPSR